MKIIYVISLILVVFGCSSNDLERPSDIINDDKLIEILADFHIMDAASKQNRIKNNHKNYVKYKQYLKILKMHKVSKEQFEKSIDFQKQNPKDFEQLYIKVTDRLKEIKANLPSDDPAKK